LLTTIISSVIAFASTNVDDIFVLMALFSQINKISGTGSVLKVAAITFANGGDNIAIYIPIFASQSIANNAITLIVFFIMLVLWCFLGYKLVKAPVVAKVLERYGHVTVPIVLIGLSDCLFFIIAAVSVY